MENELTDAAEVHQTNAKTRRSRIIRRNSSTHTSTWSDSAHLVTGFFGLKITFGEVMNVDQESNTIEIEDRLTVSMSPEHALSLSKLLQQQIRIYEERFGTIRQAPSSLEQEE